MDEETIPPFDFGTLEKTLKWVTFHGPWHVDVLEEDDYQIVDTTVATHPGPHYEETIATFSGANHNSAVNASAVVYVMTHLPEIVRLARLGMAVENPEVIAEMVGEDIRHATKRAVQLYFGRR